MATPTTNAAPVANPLWDSLVAAPEQAGSQLKEIIKTPESLKKVVDETLKHLETYSKEDVTKLVSLKKKDIKADSGEKLEKLYNLSNAVILSFMGNKAAFNDAEVITNLKSAPVKEQIARLADSEKFQKLAGLFREKVAKDEKPANTTENLAKEITNEEGKKIALALAKQFKIVPQNSFKDKLAKVWEAIKAFFYKVFCCCKKKEKEKVDAPKADAAKPAEAPKTAEAPKAEEPPKVVEPKAEEPPKVAPKTEEAKVEPSTAPDATVTAPVAK